MKQQADGRSHRHDDTDSSQPNWVEVDIEEFISKLEKVTLQTLVAAADLGPKEELLDFEEEEELATSKQTAPSAAAGSKDTGATRTALGGSSGSKGAAGELSFGAMEGPPTKPTAFQEQLTSSVLVGAAATAPGLAVVAARTAAAGPHEQLGTAGERGGPAVEPACGLGGVREVGGSGGSSSSNGAKDVSQVPTAAAGGVRSRSGSPESTEIDPVLLAALAEQDSTPEDVVMAEHAVCEDSMEAIVTTGASPRVLVGESRAALPEQQQSRITVSRLGLPG